MFAIIIGRFFLFSWNMLPMKTNKFVKKELCRENINLAEHRSKMARV